MLALSHQASGAGFFIQRAVDVDDQDIGTAMNTCCLCDSEGRTHYGGLERFEVAGRTLTLELDQHAAKVFGTRQIRFRIEDGLCDSTALHHGLTRLLEMHAPEGQQRLRP